MKPTVVPVDLGGSPTACRVRPPLRPPPGPDMLRALIRHYAEERSPRGLSSIVVSFFHGGVPPEALLDVVGGLPFRLSASPVDLDRETIERLVGCGLVRVELEALSLDAGVLRRLERGHGPVRVIKMVQALKSAGLEVGVVLAPGLPGSSHDMAVAGAKRLLAEAPPDFVRIHPALAFSGSGLAALAEQGRWVPMRLGQAVTVCEALLDRFDDAGVPVIRVGLQPRHDLPVEVVGGPVHPGLRGLVEARRFRRRMQALLVGHPRARPAVLRVNPADLAWAKGAENANIRALRAALGLRALSVEPDPGVVRGQLCLVAPATGG